jgi:hypothetical protein
MQFFNFGNSETYLFFEWVRRHHDVATLVAKAMSQVEGDEWYEMDLDVCYVACDRLQELLREILQDTLGDDPEEPLLRGGELHQQLAPPQLREAARNHQLAHPLLMEAARRIDLGTVAHALLLDAGKWSPDISPPDVL